MSIETVQEIGSHTAVITWDNSFLFQCLFIALQWMNVVSFLKTMNTEWEAAAAI